MLPVLGRALAPGLVGEEPTGLRATRSQDTWLSNLSYVPSLLLLLFMSFYILFMCVIIPCLSFFVFTLFLLFFFLVLSPHCSLLTLHVDICRFTFLAYCTSMSSLSSLSYAIFLPIVSPSWCYSTYDICFVLFFTPPFLILLSSIFPFRLFLVLFMLYFSFFKNWIL